MLRVASRLPALLELACTTVLLGEGELTEGRDGEEGADGGSSVIDCSGGVGDLDTTGGTGCDVDWKSAYFILLTLWLTGWKSLDKFGCTSVRFTGHTALTLIVTGSVVTDVL